MPSDISLPCSYLYIRSSSLPRSVKKRRKVNDVTRKPAAVAGDDVARIVESPVRGSYPAISRTSNEPKQRHRPMAERHRWWGISFVRVRYKAPLIAHDANSLCVPPFKR